MLGYFLQKLENFMFMRFPSNMYINANVVYWCYISRLINGMLFYFDVLLVVKLIHNSMFYKNVKKSAVGILLI